MTEKEYNKRVKDLARKVLVYNGTGQLLEKEFEIKEELFTLCKADEDFTYANKKSVLILLKLNLRFQVVNRSRFGSKINLETLI